MGIVGEPMILGLVIGAYNTNSSPALPTGIDDRHGPSCFNGSIAEWFQFSWKAWCTVSEAASEFMTKKFEGREIYIGMDSAIMLGDPVNLTTAVLLIPIAILLAVVLPGNKVLPLVDLPSIVYMTVVAVGLTKGNLFRSVLIGIPMLCATLWTATAMAPYVTVLAREVGFDIPAGLPFYYFQPVHRLLLVPVSHSGSYYQD